MVAERGSVSQTTPAPAGNLRPSNPASTLASRAMKRPVSSAPRGRSVPPLMLGPTPIALTPNPGNTLEEVPSPWMSSSFERAPEFGTESEAMPRWQRRGEGLWKQRIVERRPQSPKGIQRHKIDVGPDAQAESRSAVGPPRARVRASPGPPGDRACHRAGGRRPGHAEDLGDGDRKAEEMMHLVDEMRQKLEEVEEALARTRSELEAARSSSEDFKDFKSKKNRRTVYDEEDPPEEIHSKDVEKPPKYDLRPEKWYTWHSKFKAFLVRRDSRWRSILKMTQAEGYKVINKDKEIEIFRESKALTFKDLFKEQLFEYLESCTTGMAYSMVLAGKENGVLETWRQFCENGKSSRERNVRMDKRRVYHPKQVSLDGVRKAILEWETDLAQYESATHDFMPEDNKLMCLEDICPDELQKHLSAQEHRLKHNYIEYKQEIEDYLDGLARWKKGGLRALQPAEHKGHEHGTEPCEQQCSDDADVRIEELMGQLNALVKGKFQKKGDGKGKGEKRRCHECYSEEHLARDCPVRQARVAAGGPVRMDVDSPPPKGGKTGKGGGKYGKGGGKGGKDGGKNGWWPTRTAWSGYYPGPSPATWNSWWPGKGPSTGKGGTANLFEAPQQLSAFTQPPEGDFIESLMANGLGFTAKVFNTKKSNSWDSATKNFEKIQGKGETFAHETAFSKLQSEEVEHLPDRDVKFNIMDFQVPDKGQQRRRKRAHKESDGGGHKMVPKSRFSDDEGVESILNFVNGDFKDKGHLKIPGTDINVEDMANAKAGLKVFKERPKLEGGNLMKTTRRQNPTAANGWEILSSVVDSGATVPVLGPKDGAAYPVVEGEAARRGVEYAMANDDTLPNLGEKKMAVLTPEGTVRGYSTQVADVAGSLQSVRALKNTGHAVCFGLGPDGNDNLIINRHSGEINRMRDDGINFLQDMLVIPPDRIQEVIEAQNRCHFGRQGQ